MKKRKRDTSPIVPPEIVVRIASFCSGGSLATMLTICRGWYELLTNSPEVLDRLAALNEIDRGSDIHNARNADYQSLRSIVIRVRSFLHV